VGKSSRIVRHRSWAGPIFQSCPRASGAVQRLGYSVGYSRGRTALILDRLLFRLHVTVVTPADGQDYAEAGEDYYEQRDRRDREHLIRHHQQALTRLGYQVTLTPPGDGSPPPSATSQQPAA